MVGHGAQCGLGGCPMAVIVEAGANAITGDCPHLRFGAREARRRRLRIPVGPSMAIQHCQKFWNTGAS